MLADCGKRMPFLDRVEFTSKREDPAKTKFLAGVLRQSRDRPVDWILD